MPKSTQVFPLCKFRRNFCKLSIVQNYFKNQMIDKAVTTCKISKLILLFSTYVIWQVSFVKSWGKIWVKSLKCSCIANCIFWEKWFGRKILVIRGFFFATEQINPLCQFCCMKGTDFCKSSNFPFTLKEAVKFFIQCFIKHRVLFTIHHFNVLNSILYWLDEKIYFWFIETYRYQH